jgi:anti-sigma regulatory factor (Ser/Thr protein kinase)
MEGLITQPSIVTVRESSQIFESRRIALNFAESLHWDETSSGKLAIAVTEAARNLVKHGREGELHLQHCEQNGLIGVEMLALDRGPGVTNIDVCLQDGFSTSGTAGTGLGAIRRLSSEFDIFSQPGKGTALLARFFSKAAGNSAGAPPPQVTVGAVQVPIRGESVSGDSWAIRTEERRSVLLIADGLGHGPGAAEASREAVAVLKRATDLEPLLLLETVHHALRPTRGAALAIAMIDHGLANLIFAGVGNISATIISGSVTQHLVSYSGTAGQAIRKVKAFTYPWPSGALLLMHSDGIHTNWRLDAYPGLAAKRPSLIAGVLYRDARRGRDDACIVVVRGKASTHESE